MTRKRDVFDFFRDNQHRLNEAPPARSWRRLEQRLDMRRHGGHSSRFRVLGMVAGILILVTLVGLVSLSLGRQQSLLMAANRQAIPSALEDLSVTDADSEGMNTVMVVQRAQEHRQSPISEGVPGQKLVFTGKSKAPGKTNGTLEAFAWMAGRWQSREHGETAFEEWSRTSAFELKGMAGLEGKEQEHMRLYQQDNKVYFSTDFGGKTVVRYTLVAINGTEALFENLDAGFPQQVLFQRQGKSRMAAIYQNAESHLPDTERIRNLQERHTFRPMQAVRQLNRVTLQ
ncbi:MAG: hypothetical protein KDD19_20540 [Phaeodactylibacter sp.]|nr:hypothetical protein [Phaeodactylibacter sp.]MCB9049530.1 hypothetical protein [Lewinellaceae bacterium]